MTDLDLTAAIEAAKPAVQEVIEEATDTVDWYDAGDHLRDAAAEAAVRAAAPLIEAAVLKRLCDERGWVLHPDIAARLAGTDRG